MEDLNVLCLQSEEPMLGGLRQPVRLRAASAAASPPGMMRCVEEKLTAGNVRFLARPQLNIDRDVCRLVASPHGFPLVSHVFKDERRRFVAAIDKTTSDGKGILIKAFPLRTLWAQLRWRRYGFREFCHHREAVCRGIPAAGLYAYFQVTNRFGLTESCGVLVEHLAQYTTLREALRRETIDRWQALADVAGLLQVCHAKGVNHIDISVDNILTGADGLKLIDWQYASFFASPRDSQTVMQTAYFLQTSPYAADSREGVFFKNEVYARVHPDVSRDRFASLVDQLASGPRVPVRKRTNLNLKFLKAFDRP